MYLLEESQKKKVEGTRMEKERDTVGWNQRTKEPRMKKRLWLGWGLNGGGVGEVGDLF